MQPPMGMQQFGINNGNQGGFQPQQQQFGAPMQMGGGFTQINPPMYPNQAQP